MPKTIGEWDLQYPSQDPRSRMKKKLTVKVEGKSARAERLRKMLKELERKKSEGR